MLILMATFLLITKTSIGDVFADDDPNDFKSEMYAESVSKFEHITLEKADVVFMGDSIVGRGLWNEYFHDLVVANRGIGTDTSFGMVNRVEQVIALKPEKVFISGGINDLTNGYDLSVVRENYESILEKIHENIPDSKIFVQSILPIKENKRDVKNKLIKEFNVDLREITEQYNFTFIDLYSSFVDDNEQLADEYTIDGTHLTGAGYAKWVEKINEYVYK